MTIVSLNKPHVSDKLNTTELQRVKAVSINQLLYKQGIITYEMYIKALETILKVKQT